MRRFIGKILLILIVVLLAFGYWRFYWIFGEGVKAGELNYVVKKGYIFKTYEGKLIQSGFRGGTPGAIQSYDFEFSVTSEHIAQQLMVNRERYLNCTIKNIWELFHGVVIQRLLLTVYCQ